MDINGVLLFILSFITVFVKKEETVSQAASLSLGPEIKFQKNCPKLLKTIHDNNVTDYLINCHYPMGNIKKVTEEVVLQYACFIGENLISYVCENNVSISNEYLNLEVYNKTSICPFNFTQIGQLNNFPNSNLKEKLTDFYACKQVCLDLTEPKNQCIILSKLITFLSSLTHQEVPVVKVAQENKEISQTESKVPSTTVERTDKSKIVTKESHEELLEQTKRNITKKPEVTVNKPEVSSVEAQQEDQESNKPVNIEKPFPEEEETAKPPDNAPTSKSSPTVVPAIPDPSNIENSYNNENDGLKISKNDKSMNEDFENDEDSETDSLVYNMGQVPDDHWKHRLQILKMNEKNAVNKKNFDESNQNEVYSGEGFFQAEESHFFFYFLMFSSVIIIGYLAFHNKNKILAYALEGSSGRRNRRRPNPARYRKLESNLEEAISSNASQTAASSVVY